MMRGWRWFVVLMLISPLVFALGEKTFKWTPPTQNEDDTPLPNAEITEYRIYCDGQSTPLAVVPNAPLDTDTYQAPPGTFAVGSHDCTATTVAGLKSDGTINESVQSNSVNFTVERSVPRPPVFALQ